MLKNYFKIALRSLMRNRLFSFINIFGLALSMSVCMMIILRTKDQLSYDHFHAHKDRIFRVISKVTDKKNGEYLLASTPLPIKEKLNDPSIVEETVNIYSAIDQDAGYGDRAIHLLGAFTQPAFFKVFGFRLAAGNEKTALEQPNSIVLSADAAKRLFGNENPMGKIVAFDKLGDFLVTAVLQKPEGKSHLDFDVFASASSLPLLEKTGKLPPQSDSWNPFQPSYTYVLLKNASFKPQAERELIPVSRQMNRDAKESSFAFALQDFSEITAGHERMYNDIASGTSWGKIWTENGVALLILLAGCFNYTNLTIARALSRAKEVGIRKAAGARRFQIFIQYIIESVCIALLSLAIAYVILSLILRYKPFNDGYAFMPDVDLDAGIFLIFFVFSLFTGLLAGSLPAWILSSFKPVEVLKNIRIKKLFGNVSLQKSLIVFQFSLSLIILVFLSCFYVQFSHLSKIDPGFRSENIITLPLEGADPDLLTNAFVHLNGVRQVSAISDNFGINTTGGTSVSISKTGRESIRMNYYFADSAASTALKMDFLAGRDFPDNPMSDKEQGVLINEKAARLLSFKNPETAIGRALWIEDSIQVQIAGVVKDFYFQGAGNQISPLLLRRKKGAYHFLNVWVSAKNDAILSGLKSEWKKLYPHKPFTAWWFHKQLEERNDQTATLSLLGFLGLITISIGSMGLLGLVIYTVETRRKEISVRKVIGASVRQLVLLLCRGFIRLLLISGFIALPLGYVLSYFFLQNFANRSNFGIIHLLSCFLFLLCIGMFTIISQTWRAASANPADHLRME